MTPLSELLARVPVVYGLLQDALVPGGGGGYDGERVSGGGGEPPKAPANLEVAEHRHTLLRGLRWWVDAVVDGWPGKVGDSPTHMCALLLAHLHVMAPEDQAELQTNLWDWLGGAMPLVGKVSTPTPPRLPLEALDRRVPVHVAAEVLGVSVRTVQRRAPRADGTVVLREAAGPLCDQSDLPAPWCDHCRVGAHRVRTVTADLAQ